jgi:hypothetical protein
MTVLVIGCLVLVVGVIVGSGQWERQRGRAAPGMALRPARGGFLGQGAAKCGGLLRQAESATHRVEQLSLVSHAEDVCRLGAAGRDTDLCAGVLL